MVFIPFVSTKSSILLLTGSKCRMMRRNFVSGGIAFSVCCSLLTADPVQGLSLFTLLVTMLRVYSRLLPSVARYTLYCSPPFLSCWTQVIVAEVSILLLTADLVQGLSLFTLLVTRLLPLLAFLEPSSVEVIRNLLFQKGKYWILRCESMMMSKGVQIIVF